MNEVILFLFSQFTKEQTCCEIITLMGEHFNLNVITY